jgi:hypothetical protein
LREGESDVAIPRQNVLRVTLLDKSHRLRNAFIYGAVGAGTGAGISAAATRCPTPTGFSLCGVGRGAIIGGSAVVGLLGGGGIGAAIPSHPTISPRAPLTSRCETANGFYCPGNPRSFRAF